MVNEIVQNISQIRDRMASACERAGRKKEEVRLLLATKTVSPERIRVTLQQGISLIGENKIQELKEKYESLQSIPHETHFIGHLQSNKVKEAIQYASCIQSVDRWSLAQKLERRLDAEDKNIDIFIQVNTSGESSKFGLPPDSAIAFAGEVQQLSRLHIKGLMTIGLFSADAEKVRRCFRTLKRLQMELLEQDIPVHELSMGMSNDLEIAIEEGATMLRVGTAVFGRRSLPDSYYWNEK